MMQSSTKPRVTVVSLVAALLAAWRLPAMLGLSEDSTLFAASALTLVLAIGLFLLLRRALGCEDRRLHACAYGVGAVLGLFTVVGNALKQSGCFENVGWLSVLDGLLLIVLLALGYGSVLTLVYQAMQRAVSKPPKEGESLLSRVTESFWFVLVLLLACWVPAWLAFYPGTFLEDSFTQLSTYLDWVHNTHHPLLHTLFLGACITFGVEHDPDGGATLGLALYSVIQMVLLAAMVAYACRWLKRRGAPLWARLCVTGLFAFFPFYALWPFSAQKDVLFAGLALLFVLVLIDVWRDGLTPLRAVRFVAVAVLMMLMRNNGVYAFCLLIPFAVWLAQGKRVRLTALLAGALAAYLALNAGLIALTEAESGSKVEMLSIPLQQIGRTLRDHPEAIELDEEGVLSQLYESEDFYEAYIPNIADQLKWLIDYDMLDEALPELLSLWGRMGLGYPQSYAEAFLVQNLPYYLPGTDMIYHFDLDVVETGLYEIQEHSYLPALRALYERYDQTLTFAGLPGVRLLSDTAFQVWLCLSCLGFALYRRKRALTVALLYLLAIWATCLVGPVALIRYMLGLFYAMPVLLAYALVPAQRDARAA